MRTAPIFARLFTAVVGCACLVGETAAQGPAGGSYRAHAPEIDLGVAGGALVLLIGGVLLLAGRRKAVPRTGQTGA